MTPELWRKVCVALDALIELDVNRQVLELERLRQVDPAFAAEVARLLDPYQTDTPLNLERALSDVWRNLPPLAPPEEELPAQVGPYQVQEQVGKGGMGVVYRARDQLFRRSLAVKVLAAQHADNADLRRRFLEEAQLMGQLQHPGIPPVHDLGELPDGRPYFAMKLIKGQTLAARLRERASPEQDLPHLLGIFEQVCRTLAYAHAQRIIHRDLKPANVMVGAFGEVQVMDWGLAKVLSSSTAEPSEPAAEPASTICTVRTEAPDSGTQSGLAMGTPAYMAPEQARGEVSQLDERCDVFGLGAILCEMLTGQPPFTGRNSRDVLELAQSGGVTAALARLDRCGADRELVEIAKRCLSAAREGRPAQGGEVARAVADYQAKTLERLKQAELEQKESEVRAEERIRQAELERKAAEDRAAAERKRRRLTVALAAVGMAAILIGGVGWYWIDQMREASFAQTAAQVNHELGKAASFREQALQGSLSDAGKRMESARLWESALDAAQKAEGILVTGVTPTKALQRFEEIIPPLRAEAAETAKDRAMLAALEKARDRRAEITDEDQDRIPAHAIICFGYAAAAKAYATAFRDYGIDLLTLEPREAARMIRQRKIHVSLAAAIDDWLALRIDHPLAQRLLPIAADVDSDPFRNHLRAAVATADRPALHQIAQEAEGIDLPVNALLLLADGLHLAGDLGKAAEVLRRAQRLYPGDFWVNDLLGVFLFHADATQAEEAGRCFAAALALRPQAYFVYENLGNVFSWQCRWPDAIEMFDATVRMSKKEYLYPLLAKSTVLTEQGKPDAAIALCEEILQRNPSLLSPRLFLVEHLLAKGENNQALALARDFVERSQQTPQAQMALAHMALGGALLANRQAQAAIAEYERAIESHRHFEGAHFGLVVAHIVHGNVAQAAQALQDAEKLHPHARSLPLARMRMAVAQGDRQKAIAAGRQMVASQPLRWLNHFSAGKQLLTVGAVDEALAAFKETIRLGPGWHEHYLWLASASETKGDLIDAINAYRKAVELQPNDASVWNNLGLALVKKGDGDAAMTSLHRASQLNPTEPRVQENLGSLYLKKGRLDEAIATFRKATELEPSRGRCHRLLGDALKKKGEVIAAIAAYRKAIAFDPQDVLARSNLSEVLLSKGDVAEAIAVCKTVIDLDPKNAVADFNLGYCCYQKKEYDAAILHLRRATDKDPKFALSHAYLGFAYVDTQEFDTARLCLEKARSLDPTLAGVHNYLAVAYKAHGSFDAAIAAYQKATQLNPTHAVAHNNLGLALAAEGRHEDAIVAYRKAIDANAKHTPAYDNLRDALIEAGQLPAARTVGEQVLKLTAEGSPQFQIRTKALEGVDALLRLEPRLEVIVKGEGMPNDLLERLRSGKLCRVNGYYSSAVRQYDDARAHEPAAVKKLPPADYLVIACTYLRAADGKGKDAPAPPERPALRAKSLQWLRDYLQAHEARFKKDQRGYRYPLQHNIRLLLQHQDLSGVRPPALNGLSAQERKEWLLFWDDVQQLLAIADAGK